MMKAKIPILLYHDLESPDCPNEKSDEATKDTVVSEENFKAQIQYLFENGYKTISVREYFKLRTGKKNIPPKRVIITFDDGHYSNYWIAFPVLKKYGFIATFFIIADRINEQFHMSRDQIKEMDNAGMEIGSHGLTHQYLPLMKESQIRHELSESKKILETVTGRPVEYFAFPGGHYDRRILNLLPQIGYKGTCSCIQGLNNIKTDPYLLKRIEVRRKTSDNEFQHIFDMIYIILYQFVDLWKSLIRQTIGLDAYTQIRSRFYKYYIFKR